jgi:uncharacterized protein
MIINVRVKPNSSKQEVKKIEDKSYVVSLKKPAEDNKANIELIKLLKKHFKVPVKDIKIIKGLKSRNKIVEITR